VVALKPTDKVLIAKFNREFDFVRDMILERSRKEERD
jgi:hypothetical protein